MSGSANCVEEVRPADWSRCELTLFLRAARLLSSDAVCVVIEHGHSDEGEPWLVLLEPESREVFGHFAKVHLGYVACVPFSGVTQTGGELDDLLARFLRWHGMTWPTGPRQIMRNVNSLAGDAVRPAPTHLS